MKKILLIHRIHEENEYNIFAADFVSLLNRVCEEQGIDVRAEEKGFAISYWDKFKQDFKYKTPFTYFTIGEPSGYDLIIDRASYALDFVKVYIDNARNTGTFVINNQIDINNNKVLEYAIANEIGINVPKTAVPLNARHGKIRVNEEMRSCIDVDIEACFQAVGGKWPVYLKSAFDGEFKSTFKCTNMVQLYNMYKRMGTIMTLQEYIDYDKYVRCFVIGDDVFILKYDPDANFYFEEMNHLSPDEGILLTKYSRAVSMAAGYTMNALEFARSAETGEWFVIDCTDGSHFDIRPDVLKSNYNFIRDSVVKLAIELALKPPKVEVRPCIEYAKSWLKKA